jgi:hypothetical protein
MKLFSLPTRCGLLNAKTDLTTMDEEPPFIRCPCCGSLLTAPFEGSDMWECRYHLCRAVFPVFPCTGGDQGALVAEEEPGYDTARKRKRREYRESG